MKTHVLPFLLSLMLAACSLPTAAPTPLPTSTFSWTVFPSQPAEATSLTPPPSLATDILPTAHMLPYVTSASGTEAPGLVVRGRVTLDGVGLAGVSIVRQYNAYPGEVIAVTDANGYYQSGFMGIPGDEMTSITPQLAGYIFDPPTIYWRHYYGFEVRTCDFSALLTP